MAAFFVTLFQELQASYIKNYSSENGNILGSGYLLLGVYFSYGF
jgi:hypothetical protein